MSLYAFDAIDDAFAATRAFLWPVTLGRWAKLAIVVFFVGGAGGGFNPGSFNLPTSTGGGPGVSPGPGTPSGLPSIGGPELVVILTIVAVIAVLALAFLVIGSVMEFVLVESLRREAVAVRRYWRERWKQGLRLFGFRFVLGAVGLAIVGGFVAVALAPLVFNTGGPSIALVLLAVLVFIVVAVVSGVVNGFTTVFVVPIMVAEDVGVIAAWQRLWAAIRAEPKQYAVYLVMGFVLQIAAGIVAVIGTIVLAVLLAIPLGIIAVVGAGLLAVASILGWIVIGVAVVLFALAMIAVVLLIGVPIQTFLRYYALFVLGDSDERYELIADRRAAVRNEATEG